MEYIIIKYEYNTTNLTGKQTLLLLHICVAINANLIKYCPNTSP